MINKQEKLNNEENLNNENPVNLPKKRGRKKKVVVESGNNSNKSNNGNNSNDSNDDNGMSSKKQEQSQEMIESLQIEQVKKKRGRKKKWEVETTTKIIENNPITFSENSNKTEIKDISDNYESENILFGTLNIKIHSNKEVTQINDIKECLTNNDNNLSQCKINLTNSDYDDTDDENDYRKNTQIIEKNLKVMKYYEDEFDTGNEILISAQRCYNCHYTFKNKPFFLPIDYSSELQRFKVTGNFCSPNCVKSYALNSKLYCNKIYLVSHMYRKLFGANYKIKLAPPIQCLKDYGGNMTINEYRASFENDVNYSLKNICSKIVMDEIIDN